MHRTIALSCLIVFLAGACAEAQDVHLGNGIKIGEVRHDSAIIWTRLTRHAKRNLDGADFTAAAKKKHTRPTQAQQIPSGKTLDEMIYALPGKAGDVRVLYRKTDQDDWTQGDWWAVDPEADFTRQIRLAGLEAATRYRIRVQARPRGQKTPSAEMEGRFITAEESNEPQRVVFCVNTGQHWTRHDAGHAGFAIYPEMRKLDPSFYVHTGDIVYYDSNWPQSTTAALARYKWHRTYGADNAVEFHRQVASYFIKDDHDTLRNDCWPGQSFGDLTWEQGLALFREQVPMGDKTYRTIRWGKDLQIWLVEGRDYRSSNRAPDGPDKTIWGKEQKQWFFRTVEASDATFRILISPTPIVGPDRGGKKDNHANKVFAHEGNELRSFIAKQKNMFVICGDRHWQYVSQDPETGVKEFSCGPMTDRHAGGFSNSNRQEMHKYLNVVGGFLSVTVDRANREPRAVFRHHATDGKVLNEVTQSAR
jgi:alkaline phosphatase D